METKEQKPWYHGAKWSRKIINGYGFDQITQDGEICICDVEMIDPVKFGVAQVGGYGGVPIERMNQHADLIASAPETATQRDSLLSVQKQLVEALEDCKWLFEQDELKPLMSGRWGDPSVVADKVNLAILAAKAWLMATVSFTAPTFHRTHPRNMPSVLATLTAVPLRLT